MGGPAANANRRQMQAAAKYGPPPGKTGGGCEDACARTARAPGNAAGSGPPGPAGQPRPLGGGGAARPQAPSPANTSSATAAVPVPGS